MTWVVWLTYVAASSALIVVPGPAMAYLLWVSSESGLKAGSCAALGLVLGVAVTINFALFGAGAMLVASPSGFEVLKLGGGVILILLGLSQLRSRGRKAASTKIDGRLVDGKIVLNATLVSILNPKVIVFFLAYLPQFIDPDRNYFTQAIVLSITFQVLTAIFGVFGVIIAHHLRHVIQNRNSLTQTGYIGALILISAGLITVCAP